MLAPAPQIRYTLSRDGYRLAARVWDVSSGSSGRNPRANIVCLHGILSHGGWYLSSCAHLAKAGFAVHLLDRRGSGLNPLARGDVDRWNTWLSDIEDFLQDLPSAGEVPRILLGISWGATLAAAVARHRSDLLAGVGLICPGLYSRKQANVFQRCALRLAGMLGLKKIRVDIPLKDPALFTGTEAMKNYVATDPLALRRITIRFALENLRLGRYATERPEQIRVPTLVMLAELDPIAVNPLVRGFVDRVGHKHKRVIEYPNASHTLEFEPNPVQYYDDLCGWCREIT